MLGKGRARAKENVQLRPHSSHLMQSVVKLPVLAKKSRNLLPKHTIGMLQLLGRRAAQIELRRVALSGQLQKGAFVSTQSAEMAAFAKGDCHRMQRKNL